MRKMSLADFMQLSKLLDTIGIALAAVEKHMQDADGETIVSSLNDISETCCEINQSLFFCKKLKNYPIGECVSSASAQNGGVAETICLIREWAGFVAQIIRKRQACSTDVDMKFDSIMDFVAYVDEETIIDIVKSNLYKNNADRLNGYNRHYQIFSYFWGTLDTKQGNYEVINNRVNVLVQNREDFIWLYEHLGDYRSKVVLVCMLSNWLTFDFKYIENMYEMTFEEYYDLDLLHCAADEVVVDLGAYIGDSAISFIDTYMRYKKIYCYEISQDNIEIMRKNLSSYNDIEICHKGVGAKNGEMYVGVESSYETNTQNESVVSCNRLKNDSGQKVEVVTLDDDIQEKITLIKMDIEGAEQDALKGSRRHIEEEKPKLLVSVYHNNRDIFEIPHMIMDMRDDYKFYLRSKGSQWRPAEITLFAL